MRIVRASSPYGTVRIFVLRGAVCKCQLTINVDPRRTSRPNVLLHVCFLAPACLAVEPNSVGLRRPDHADSTFQT